MTEPSVKFSVMTCEFRLLALGISEYGLEKFGSIVSKVSYLLEVPHTVHNDSLDT